MKSAGYFVCSTTTSTTMSRMDASSTTDVGEANGFMSATTSLAATEEDTGG